MDNAFDFVKYPHTLLMKHSNRFLLLSLAIIVGLGGAAATALAQAGDTIVTLCYRNRTIKVPSYLAQRYLNRPGTTSGPCGVVTNP